jgi:hypothetical protein
MMERNFFQKRKAGKESMQERLDNAWHVNEAQRMKRRIYAAQCNQECGNRFIE